MLIKQIGPENEKCENYYVSEIFNNIVRTGHINQPMHPPPKKDHHGGDVSYSFKVQGSADLYQRTGCSSALCTLVLNPKDSIDAGRGPLGCLLLLMMNLPNRLLLSLFTLYGRPPGEKRDL